MNSPDPDSRFEEALSSFRRPPLPSAWREELLDKALPARTRAPDEAGLRRGLARLTRTDRALAAMLALAWFVIGVLWVTNPAGNPASPARTAARNRPHAQFPTEPGENYMDLISRPAPHIFKIMKFSKFLSLRSSAAIAAGKREIALEAIVIRLRLAEATGSQPMLISHLNSRSSQANLQQ